MRWGRAPSELRAAVDPQRVAGDPPRGVRGEEGDGAGDVVRLGDALQRLDAEREVAPGIGLGEARHVGLDDAGRHGVDADAAPAERRAKCFTKVSMAPLVEA